jgi:hypothetical protein
VRYIWGLAFLSLLICWTAAATSQSGEWIAIGQNAFAFHEEKFHELNFELEPPVTSDAEILVELIGPPNVEKINALHVQIRRVAGLNNAASLEANGYRTIAYDPDWAAGDTPGFYLVLGHEAGHLFCGHTPAQASTNRMQIELESDQFGGASIKRLEIYQNRSLFGQVFSAALTKYPEQGSSIYPPRSLRLEALRSGYEQGSPCGNLAPVEQSGFYPGTRANGPPTPCHPVRTGPTSYACEH